MSRCYLWVDSVFGNDCTVKVNNFAKPCRSLWFARDVMEYAIKVYPGRKCIAIVRPGYYKGPCPDDTDDITWKFEEGVMFV